MSPEMLTLVAVVLAYDIALETCDLLSSTVEMEEVPVPRAICRRSLGLSLNDRSWTRLEKDMIAEVRGNEYSSSSKTAERLEVWREETKSRW